MVDEITPADLRARLDDAGADADGTEGVDDDTSLSVVDIRDPATYADGHIAGAVNVPPSRLSTTALDAAWAQADEIVVACYVGESSKRVASTLARHLDADVSSLRGGFDAWHGPTAAGREPSTAESGRRPDEGPSHEGPDAPF